MSSLARREEWHVLGRSKGCEHHSNQPLWWQHTSLPSRICSLTMTTLTTFGSLNVRKPKPRDLPVAPSRITVHSVTSPNWEKYSLRDSINVSEAESESYCITRTISCLPVETANEHFAVVHVSKDDLLCSMGNVEGYIGVQAISPRS